MPLVFFLIKGTPLREKEKTGFSVLAIIELNLMVELTIPAKDRLRTFNLKKP
jgi:hypothetical protein